MEYLHDLSPKPLSLAQDAGHAHAAGEEAPSPGSSSTFENPVLPGVLSSSKPLIRPALAHHESVIHGEAVHLINAQRLHLLVFVLVAQEVCTGECSSERTIQSKNHYALALEEILGGHVLPGEWVLHLLIRAYLRALGCPRSLERTSK